MNTKTKTSGAVAVGVAIATLIASLLPHAQQPPDPSKAPRSLATQTLRINPQPPVTAIVVAFDPPKIDPAIYAGVTGVLVTGGLEPGDKSHAWLFPGTNFILSIPIDRTNVPWFFRAQWYFTNAFGTVNCFTNDDPAATVNCSTNFYTPLEPSTEAFWCPTNVPIALYRQSATNLLLVGYIPSMSQPPMLYRGNAPSSINEPVDVITGPGQWSVKVGITNRGRFFKLQSF